ncbi:hypothetical protein [Mucilaginibacter sp. FT3.2]|uniref:hypothetical protein n=1 Tax=Mucilaginibacter sp. FT3.2 TaxID=2723090 RepID=UPI00161EDC7B|nr:hypothetical protein [Mucilaginibacter sp. FT3.2]MBB6230938.1 hypothetical protein [Mucilaginibacter sp. FT3.2]
MRILIIFLLIGMFSELCFGQIKESKDQEIIKKAKFISVYKIDRNAINCFDKKNITLIVRNSISTCFRLKKKLGPLLAKRVAAIFLNKHSFENKDQNCFTTDFGMILFDDRKRVIGNITMSLVCNNLSFNNSVPLKLTNKAKNKLLEIIR